MLATLKEVSTVPSHDILRATFDPDDPVSPAPAPWQQAVQLPATGAWVSTFDFQVRFNPPHWDVIDPDGVVVARVSENVEERSLNVEVEKNVEALALLNEVVCFAELAGVAKHDALAELCDRLIAEADETKRLDQLTETCLVWCAHEGDGTGQWMVERGMSAYRESDLREVRFARHDAAYFWRDGGRHPFEA